jgi:hypothetical protein
MPANNDQYKYLERRGALNEKLNYQPGHTIYNKYVEYNAAARRRPNPVALQLGDDGSGTSIFHGDENPARTAVTSAQRGGGPASLHPTGPGAVQYLGARSQNSPACQV